VHDQLRFRSLADFYKTGPPKYGGDPHVSGILRTIGTIRCQSSPILAGMSEFYHCANLAEKLISDRVSIILFNATEPELFIFLGHLDEIP
jgi:hypothetical protein